MRPMRPMGLIGPMGLAQKVSKMCGRGCPKCAGGGVQNVRERVSKMSRMVVKLKSVVLKRSL